MQTLKERAYEVAEEWYDKYQYEDLTRTKDVVKRKALLSNLLLALSVLLPEYEVGKAGHADNTIDDNIDEVAAWFCATYGWYYYSYQQDKLKKEHASLVGAGCEPKLDPEKQWVVVL